MLRSETRSGGPARLSGGARRRPRGPAALLLGCLLVAGGCDDPQPARPADAGAAEAGAKGPVLDPKLNAAVAAAASSGRAVPAAPNAGGGPAPPEHGVFTGGKADSLHARGAPSKIELLGEGSEPRASLAAKLDGATEQKAKVTLQTRSGGQGGLPTMDFVLSIKQDKPKDGDKPKEGEKAKPATAPKAPDGAIAMIARVSSVTPAGQLPKDATEAIGKLKGSAVRWYVARPDGGAAGWSIELAKGADAQLDTVVRALADVLAAMHVPAPPKPVGAGAYWMVSDRANSAGVEVLRYRVFRVEKMDDKKVKLSVELRQYAADDKVEGAVGAKNMDLTVEMFESQGKGALELTLGDAYPHGGELSQKLSARLKPPQGNQRMPVQFEITSKVGSVEAAAH